MAQPALAGSNEESARAAAAAAILFGTLGAATAIQTEGRYGNDVSGGGDPCTVWRENNCNAMLSYGKDTVCGWAQREKPIECP